jgi:hypothetical protein
MLKHEPILAEDYQELQGSSDLNVNWPSFYLRFPDLAASRNRQFRTSIFPPEHLPHSGRRFHPFRYGQTLENVWYYGRIIHEFCQL